MTTMIDLYLFCHIFACLWIEVEDWDSTFQGSDYLNAIYFIYQTAAVVGYGDYYVNHQSLRKQNARMLYAIAVLFFGATFVGYTFAMINKTVQHMKEVSDGTVINI